MLSTALFASSAAGALVGACVSGEFEDGTFLCDRAAGADTCPEGMTCAADGTCRRGALAADAGTPDADADADAPDAPCTDATCPEGTTCTGGVCVPICDEPTWKWEAPGDVTVDG